MHSFLRILSVPLFLMFTLSACGKSDSSFLSATPVNTKNALIQLDNAEQFTKFSTDSGGLIVNGRSLKFLIDFRAALPSPAADGDKAYANYFINGNCQASAANCSSYHFDFAEKYLRIPESLETFNKVTYFSDPKRYAAGSLNFYTTAELGEIYAIQLYPQDVASEATILKVVKNIKNSFKLPGARLVFIPTGNQQTVSTIKDSLKTLGIDILNLDAIFGTANFIPMHPQEAWGYLRMFPKDQDAIAPTDIVVFDELPLDLTVVAGVITHAFQDSNSHINLKSKERNTPNMVLRDASADNPLLAPWIDQPIHLTVAKTGWSIEASTDSVIQAKAQVRAALPWKSIRWNTSRILRSYDKMCVGSPSACLKLGTTYGSKAANLGFLKEVFKNRSVPDQTAKLSYDPVPKGFGVPLQFYKDLIDLPANAAVKAKLDAFVAREKSGLLTQKERADLSLEIRNDILNAEVPAENLAKIRETMTAVDASIVKWKIRSSANAEDIEGFDGAGLHDSYSSKTDTADNAQHSCKLVLDDDVEPGELSKFKVKPKSVSCAIKGVYASLWNKRAIDERTFARIDHGTLAMGLSILPSYDTESPVIANSVVVTRVINSPDVLGYAMSIQKDNNTVTNPTPGTWSELTVAALGGKGEPTTLSTLRFAKPTPVSEALTSAVLPKETTLLMANLTRKVEEAYCKAKSGYYSGPCADVYMDSEKPKALDLEMKYLQNGEFVIKQVREFSGK